MREGTSEVSFDGSSETDGDDVASLGLFGGGAKSFGSELWERLRYEGRHFRVDRSVRALFLGVLGRPEVESTGKSGLEGKGASEVSFDGSSETEGDDVASLGLFGGGAKSFSCEFWERLRYEGRHFRIDRSVRALFLGVLGRPEVEVGF
ncbi:hypothetical protein U1Q18_019817 [Sarracenia purpurea var. burkii]